MFFAFLRGDSHWPGLARLFGRPRCAQSDAPRGSSPPHAISSARKGGYFSPIPFPLFCPLGNGIWPRRKLLNALLSHRFLWPSSGGPSRMS